LRIVAFATVGLKSVILGGVLREFSQVCRSTLRAAFWFPCSSHTKDGNSPKRG
jgi:hypothetical protein